MDYLKRQERMEGPGLKCWIMHERHCTHRRDGRNTLSRPTPLLHPPSSNQTFCLRFNASFRRCQHLPEVQLMSDALLRSGVSLSVSLYTAPPTHTPTPTLPEASLSLSVLYFLQFLQFGSSPQGFLPPQSPEHLT